MKDRSKVSPEDLTEISEYVRDYFRDRKYTPTDLVTFFSYEMILELLRWGSDKEGFEEFTRKMHVNFEEAYEKRKYILGEKSI